MGVRLRAAVVGACFAALVAASPAHAAFPGANGKLAFSDCIDEFCGSLYTSNADGRGQVQLGHSDKQGGNNSSWNSTHASRGCSQANLVSTGGAGLLYCFAVSQ